MGDAQAKLGSIERDTDGRWITLPSARKAAAHATPFPDWDDDEQVGMAVHDINVAQMVRIAEREEAR